MINGAPVGTPGSKRTESGLGDVLVGLGWKKRLHTSGTTGEIAGTIKLPTADEDRSLGTGLTDYTLQAGIIQPLGKAYVTGHAGRRFNNTSTRFPLENMWKATLGAGYEVTDDTTLGFLYDYRQAQSANANSLKQLTAYGSHKLSEDFSIQIYFLTGFTDSSPDAGVGLQLTKRFSFD